MKRTTRKLTVAAVCTALAIILCVMTAYLPLSFMPLYLAAFCIFLACKRSGVAYGSLCAAASVGLMFLMTGLSVKWLLFLIMFAPYGILTYFTDKLIYFKPKTAVLRALIAIVYFNVTFGAVYAITVNVISVGLDGINIAEWASRVGGYAVLAVIATAVLLPLDFIFSTVAKPILKRIPSDEKKPPINASKQVLNDNKSVDEVFGYEIFGGDSGTHDDVTEHDTSASDIDDKRA